MTRRALLARLFARDESKKARPGKTPTEDGPMNRFADRYNTYAELLKRGVIDTAAWRRVERAWREMTEI